MRTLLYLAFIGVMIRMHTFPLYSIRPFYLTLKVCDKVISLQHNVIQILQSLKKAVSDVILSRRAIHAMSHLFPDVTADDLATGLFLQNRFVPVCYILNAADPICIICRENMTATVGSAKRLPCA